MKNCISYIFAWIIVILFAASNRASAQQRLEFNGPMAGWADVKARFSAAGDGKKDDTRALQRALDSLSVPPMKYNTGKQGYMVIYLPRGHYRISQTLTIKGKIGFEIIGESPENTVIEWAGADKDTMLWANGSAYFKISRISFNGKGKSNIEAIGIHWKDNYKNNISRSYAPTSLEISACNFSDVEVGIGGGFKWSDSEVKISECVFNQCTRAGISIMGYNALDYWIWNCKFLGCNIGVDCSRGNYHVYNSYFKGSIVSDLMNDNGYYTSVRGCYSDHSKAFSIDKGASSNPFKRIFQDNIVSKPENLPIIYNHPGKPTFYGNSFDKTRSDTTGKKMVTKDKKISVENLPGVLSYSGWLPSNYTVLSIENRYYYPKPFRINAYFPNVLYESGDQYGRGVNADPAGYIATMDKVPVLKTRPVLEILPGSGAEEIQAIIDKAADLKGKRPIVHFPFGDYTIEKTIIIPPGCDMKIIGDGMRQATVLRHSNKKSFKGQAILQVEGPTTVEIADIHFSTADQKMIDAIRFTNIDQPNAKVHLDQIYSHADTTLFINGLDNVYFEKNNSFFSDGNVVIGGDLQKAGKGNLVVNCFGGQFSRVELQHNASFVAKDCWWEGPREIPIDLKGSGNLTIDGTKMGSSSHSDSLPIIRMNGFTGKFSMLNCFIQGGIEIGSNNSNLSFLLWNANFYHKKDISSILPRQTRAKIAYAGVTTQCFYKDDPYCKQTKTVNDQFLNVANKMDFLVDMTKQTRNARPQPYMEGAKGVSNIYMSRISFDLFKTALSFSR